MKKEFALFDIVEVPKHVFDLICPLYGKVFRVVRDGAFVAFGRQPEEYIEDTNFVPLVYLLRVIDPSTGDFLFEEENYRAVLELAKKEFWNSYRYFSNEELQELENVTTKMNFKSLGLIEEELSMEVAKKTHEQKEHKQIINGVNYK